MPEQTTTYPKPMPDGLMAKIVRRTRRSKTYCSFVYNGRQRDSMVEFVIQEELSKLQPATGE